MTAGSFWMRSGGPSAMRRPKSSTVTESAIRMISPMSCSTMRIEMFRASRTRAIVSAIAERSVGCMPATGSSRSSSLGSMQSARAISTRLRSPYASPPTGLSKAGPRPRKSAISAARSRWRRCSRAVWGSRSALAVKPARVSRWRPSMRLSATVPWVSTMFWKVRATPS